MALRRSTQISFWTAWQLGQLAVAAGIIMGFHVAAVWAEAPVAARLPGLAAHDGVCSLTLDVGLGCAGCGKFQVGRKEKLLYFERGENPLDFLLCMDATPNLVKGFTVVRKEAAARCI